MKSMISYIFMTQKQMKDEIIGVIELIDRIYEKEIDPYSAAAEILSTVLK